MSQAVDKSQEVRPRRRYAAPALAKGEKLARLAAAASTASTVIVDGAR